MEDLGGPVRVLVAEDSETVRRLVGRLLARAGFEVIEAVDGIEAIRRCALDRPHVVVMDLEMPLCDGLTALDRIRRDPALADTQVILLTSTQDPQIARDALARGAVDVVRKPCHPGELVSRVERAAASFAAVAELRRRTATDELTGLPNRRGVEAVLAGLAAPYGEAVGLLLLDIDHFKAVNDTWGHVVGDGVLREVARRLDLAADPCTAARWGGEEFLVAGALRGHDELAGVAERLRAAVAAAPILVRSGPAGGLEVRVSIGAVLATRPSVADGSALAAADTALYEAKRTGRDRAVIATLTPDPGPEAALAP